MSPRGRAILALALLVPVPSLVAHVATGVSPGPVGFAAMALGKVWILMLPWWWWVRMEKQPVRIGWPRRDGLGVGLLCGMLSVVAIVAAYLLVGDDRIPVASLRAIAGKNGWSNPVFFIALAVGYSVGNSLLEEYVWRWFVVRQCEAAIAGRALRVPAAAPEPIDATPPSQSSWPSPPLSAWQRPSVGIEVAAVLLSALFFTAHHTVLLFNQMGLFVAALGSAGVFVGGAAWSWLYARYGSIWPGYIAHVCADAAIFVIGWRILQP